MSFEKAQNILNLRKPTRKTRFKLQSKSRVAERALK